MGFGVGSCLEYLRAELVAHEDVVVQVDVHTAAGCTRHLTAQRQHLGAVGGEMQVRTADSARPHRHQNLTGTGHGIGHVVAVHHAAFPQYRGAHQLLLFSVARSPTCSVIAFTTACPARPINSSRLSLAHS